MRRAHRPLLFVVLTAVATAQTTTPAPQPAREPTPDELYQLGKQLFDQLAPPEIKAQYEFPSKEQWDEFALRLQRALEGGSLEELAAYEAEARAALAGLRLLPGHEDYADWLEQRIDEIQGAKQATAPVLPPKPPAPTPRGTQPPPTRPASPMPHYDLWLARVRGRPMPARASSLMPRLRAAFVAEGVPPEVAWLAEAESSLNPAARSPVGAKGLFQFMPDTAKAMGLTTFIPDERNDPDKSARAAARYLKSLYGKFGSWPLAFAAYNAGEGRLRRAMTAKGAKDFAGVANSLPAETRMYVPKVCALIATRTGVTPDRLAAPRT
ncbi:MAG: lytic transglycosylase domain-containing protein [Verrucomicrobia bacterium]|nr:lytic transglycosylase domain-containing protein [Verrucomicrobiota bacterium]